MRCVGVKRAVTVSRVTFGGDTYDLDLCEAHADMLWSDIHGWTRLGTLVENSFFTPLPKPRDEVPAPVRPVPTPPTTPPLPPLVARWRLTVHAQDRLTREGDRAITADEARRAAQEYRFSRAGRDPGTQVRTRGDVQVVVDERRLLILTVVAKRHREQEQEQEQR